MTTRRSPKKTDDRQAWFKYQLDRVGSNYQRIGEAVGVSRQRVRQSILNPPPHIADAIAAAIGKEKGELWPHRYSINQG